MSPEEKEQWSDRLLAASIDDDGAVDAILDRVEALEAELAAARTALQAMEEAYKEENAMADLLTVQLRHALAAQPRLAERIDLSRPDPDPASLLPCPFCGGKPEIIGGSGEYRAISCQSCSASCDEVVQDGRAEANWSRRVAAPPRPKAIVIMPAKHSEAGIHAFQQNVEATAYWVRWAHCGAEIHTDCNYTWHSATPKKETSSVAVIATRSGEPCPTCCSTNTVRYTPDCYRCLDCGNTFSDHEEDDTDD